MFTKNLMLSARRNNNLSMMAARSSAGSSWQSDLDISDKKKACHDLTWELKEHLRRLGITNPNIV